MDQIPIFYELLLWTSTSLCQQQGRASKVTSIREIGTAQVWGFLLNPNTEQQHSWEAETAQQSTWTALRKTPIPLPIIKLYHIHTSPETSHACYSVQSATQNTMKEKHSSEIIYTFPDNISAGFTNQNRKSAKAKTMTMLLWLIYPLIISLLSL